MTSLAYISQALGDYMLKGWVLTDQSCSTPGCTVPLLRSPRGKTPITTLCVKCDAKNAQAIHLPQEGSQLPAAPSNTSTESIHSPSSTPPTEFSAIPDSPVFVPLEESEQSRRRREQSDQASSEIGSRLLKGWAMLGDECLNETCYGVPLVRPPKSGPEKDPRKECVICGNVYITETDWAGRESLVPFESKINEQIINTESQAGGSLFPHISSPVHKFSKGKQKAPVEVAELPSALASRPIRPASLLRTESTSSIPGLDETSRVLQNSLQVLSTRLSSMSSPTFDPTSIGATADAIGKVAQALTRVRQLQRDQL
ncbi:hypothetical protein BDN70DRAFT_829175 [Pholiota conissans]|uniref:Uncharacterized protein n=1 Tax=Pholiota conissans TaxID=109636 RepID=A0A9P5ZAL4_9AGAR|nr:hypothetical protein BDN70DRAFT_829175 [Pholiota conissans]